MNDIEVPTELEEAVANAMELREELTHLAEAGDIKYSVKFIKKSNHKSLERIKRDYLRKQTDEVNEFISDNLITKLSELMNNLEMVEESEKMGRELQDNKLLKRELKSVIGRVTTYIPLIGLLCGGAIIGKYVISRRYSNKSVEHREQEQKEQKEQEQQEQHED